MIGRFPFLPLNCPDEGMYVPSPWVAPALAALTVVPRPKADAG
jgi:hypothetical protein